MDVEIVAPKTVITASILKLHLSYKILNSENRNNLKIIENNFIIETVSKGASSRADKTN